MEEACGVVGVICGVEGRGGVWELFSTAECSEGEGSGWRFCIYQHIRMTSLASSDTKFVIFTIMMNSNY